MKFKQVTLILAAAACCLAARGLQAGDCVPGCSYERVIYVPEYCTETRTITCVEYEHEQRERPYTVYRCVPETHQVSRKYTVWVPEKRIRQETYTVCVPVTEPVTEEYQVKVPVWTDREVHYKVKVPVWSEREVHYKCLVPVWTDKEIPCTVMVPHTEKRTGTRAVCHLEPVHTTRKITRDCGHWETRIAAVPCGGCGACGGCCTRTICQRVWCSNVVTEEVPCTTYKRVVEHVPYEYCVTVCRPETHIKIVKVCNYVAEPRTKIVKVCDYVVEPRTKIVRDCHYELQTRKRTYDVCRYVREERTRDVCYTECVPQVHTKVCDVTTFTKVAEERIATYNVCIPVRVEKEVQVQVCRMVPKRVIVSCGGCGGCY